jgi:cytochrome c oxidase subunit 4
VNPELRRRMREPALVTSALLAGLAINVALAALQPFAGAGYVEAAVAAAMVATVLLFSMDVRRAAPLLQLFAAAGFFWLAILFAMTLLDYFTR